MSHRTPCTRVTRVLLLVLLGTVSFVLDSGADGGPATLAGASPPDGNEFPDIERELLRHLEQGWNAKQESLYLTEGHVDALTVSYLIHRRSYAKAMELLDCIVETNPGEIAPALEAMGDAWRGIRSDHQRDHLGAIEAILDEIDRISPGLPRETQAEIAWQRMLLERQVYLETKGPREYEDIVAEFLGEYRDTELAQSIDLKRLVESDEYLEACDSLQAVVDAWPGTVLAAEALFSQCSLLEYMAQRTRTDTMGIITARVLPEIVRLVQELESGRYPDCQWVRTAHRRVIGFWSPHPPQDREDVQRMLDAFREFLAGHIELPGADWLVMGHMLPLYDHLGYSFAGVERLLSELEAEAEDPDAVRYLRIQCYLKLIETPPLLGPDPMISTAVDSLTVLHEEGEGVWQRKALAQRALLHASQGELADAASDFRRYARMYPESPYAWVAELRSGHCEELMGNLPLALRHYRTVATRYPDVPHARVFGWASAAHALESLQRFQEAIEAYQTALAGWDDDFRYYMGAYYRTTTPEPRPRIPDGLEMDELIERIEELQSSLAVAGGQRIERGKWLMNRERWGEARQVLEQVLRQQPDTPVASRVRLLAHLSRLMTALELADVESESPDPEAAARELEAMLRDPSDPGVSLALMALGCLRLNAGATAEAESLTAEALGAWYAWQEELRVPSEPTPAEREALALRDLLLGPEGNQGRHGHPPYRIVDPDVEVTLADGTVLPMTLDRPIAGVDSVLFVDAELRSYLGRIIRFLGGTKTREPTAIMEVPNQPIGGSQAILDLWRGYFACRPGHWMGWVFQSYPIVSRIQFHNDDLTRAGVPVTVGYQGHTAILEKRDGVWTVKKTVDHWIT